MCLKYGKTVQLYDTWKILAWQFLIPSIWVAFRLEKYDRRQWRYKAERVREKDPSYSEQKPYWPFLKQVDLSSLNCIVFSQSF